MRSHITAIILAAAILTGTVAVGQGGGGPGLGQANIFVDTSGGTCTRQASLVEYDDNSACASPNAAYQAASPGDTIRILTGAYGSSSINFRSGMSAARVNMYPATGATPTFTDILWKASYVNMVGAFTFRTLDIGDVPNIVNPQRITDVTFDGITVDHQDATTPTRRTMMVSATDNVTVRNFDIGNTTAGLNVGEDSNLVQTLGGPAVYNTNLTFEYGRLHDNGSPSVTNAHNECMYAVNVAPLTVRNVLFESCTYYGIFLTDFNDPGIPETGDNLLIENNVFRQGQTSDGSPYVWAISFHPQVDQTPVTNAVIQYNTIENGLSLGFTGTPGSLTVRGNIIAKGAWQDDASSAQCRTGVTFTKNVMPTNCGATNTTRTEAQIRADWVSVNTTWGAAEDFHLVTGAAAIGQGDTASYPATDIDLVARTSPPDAGAYKGSGGGGGGSIPVNSTIPSVSGTTTQGSTLNTDNGTWTQSPTSFTYKWRRCNTSGASCADIGAATTASYALIAGDVGSTIRSQVTATNGTGSSTPAESNATATITSGGGPPPGSANVWVDNNGGTCTRQASPAAYVDSAACSTFDQAWDVMSSGDTARVVAGTYGQQVLTGNKTSTTTIIGSSVTTTILQGSTSVNCGYQDGLICANANFLKIQDMTINTANSHGQTNASQIVGTNVTFDNVYMYGIAPSIYITAPNFTWHGGKLGADGTTGWARQTLCDGGVGDGEPIWIESSGTGATIDGVRINPQLADDTPVSCSSNGFHLENIRVQAAQNVTIKNSWFLAGSDAGSGHIFVTEASPSSTAATGFTLRNNIFEPVNGTYAMQVHSNVTNCSWTFAYNTMMQPFALTCNDNAATWIGNLGVAPGCVGTHTKNVFQRPAGGSACGTDTFVTGPANGYGNLGIGTGGKLNAGSPAIDAAETPGGADFCTHQLGAVDFEGTIRPQGTICDAGADER